MYTGTPPPPEIWPMNDFEKKLPHHEMMWVEGGMFWMGSDEEEASDDEKPVHEVLLTSFCMGQFLVTQALYTAVMEVGNPSAFPGEDRPVEQVSWENAKVFVQKLNEKTGRTPAQWQYVLPSEAQWEYAASGGNTKQNTKYAGSNKLKEVGWFETNSHGKTKSVGLKLPNELGLYDMSGNVEEWCHDWWADAYYQECAAKGIVSDPVGPNKGSSRVARGGSWFSRPQFCRVTYRRRWLPGRGDNSFGFRLCLVSREVGVRTGIL